jgi:hypothetical protein
VFAISGSSDVTRSGLYGQTAATVDLVRVLVDGYRTGGLALLDPGTVGTVSDLVVRNGEASTGRAMGVPVRSIHIADDVELNGSRWFVDSDVGAGLLVRGFSTVSDVVVADLQHQEKTLSAIQVGDAGGLTATGYW